MENNTIAKQLACWAKGVYGKIYYINSHEMSSKVC